MLRELRAWMKPVLENGKWRFEKEPRVSAILSQLLENLVACWPSFTLTLLMLTTQPNH